MESNIVVRGDILTRGIPKILRQTSDVEWRKVNCYAGFENFDFHIDGFMRDRNTGRIYMKHHDGRFQFDNPNSPGTRVNFQYIQLLGLLFLHPSLLIPNVKYDELSSVGFNKYLITEYGSVWNIRLSRYVEWSVSSGGYPKVKLSTNSCDRVCREMRVHRLVAMVFLPKPKNATFNIVNHLNGDKYNPHYSNLEWCTPAMNLQHAKDTGLLTFKRRKLTNEDYNLIVACLKKSMKYVDIVELYDIPYSWIVRVSNEIRGI